MHNPLNLPIGNPLLKWVVEKTTRLDLLRSWYDEWLMRTQGGLNDANAFLAFTLGKLHATLAVEQQENLESLPKNGPLIIVANHPLGGLEGMLLSQLLLRYRPDLKVLTNELLLHFPEFKDLFVGVNVLSKDAQQANSKGIRVIGKHLSDGGALLIFPAGTVSQISLPTMKIDDSEWHSMVGRLALKYKAACLPIRVTGHNKLSFYLAGVINKRLRTALLPRAMINRTGAEIKATIGQLITSEEIQHLNCHIATTHYFRLCSELLSAQSTPARIRTIDSQKIKSDIDSADIRKQIDSLVSYRVIEQGDFSVYIAPYSAMGNVMEQLAIEREHSFRGVDEGTGLELDSDRFDAYYWHLWVWDKTTNRIAGGYRLAKIDEVAERHGVDHLYSRSLYHYDHDFIDHMGKSVEVGRSFIAPDYQRHPKILDLLWKGIGAFMVSNPGYHTLFGCVSISQQYSLLARTFLADTFIYHYGADESIKKKIQPANPIQLVEKPWSDQLLTNLSNIPIINKLLGRIDSGRSIPILIRHYLALNGKFVSFTVNSGFNQSLDGLILVDLRLAPEKYLNRYLGVEGAKQFKHMWEIQRNAA